MLEKNYANPEDRGRFGFSMSGEYRAPYKSETVFVMLLLGAAVLAGLVLFFVLNGVLTQSQNDLDGTAPFVLITCVIAIVVFVIVLIVIFGVGIRNVKKGYRCRYSANDQTFTVTVGGDLRIIRYSDVTSVKFNPRSSFGKIRGYDVVIRVNGSDQLYSICSDGYLSPPATPFYIIQERMELFRRPNPTPQINTARADSKGITRAEIDKATGDVLGAMDRMAQLLGETSNMPELSASPAPVKKTAAEVNKNNEYSSDQMPAIGQTVRRPVQTYMGGDGREHVLTDIQAQGTFYVKAETKLVVLFTFLGMAAGGALLFLLWNLLYFINALLPADASKIVGIALVVLAEPFIAYYMLTHIRGKLHTYRADGRGFFVSVKGRGDDTILYKDVLSVDYTPTKLLWLINGFEVDILTTYGLIHYDYIFPNIMHKIPRQNLPFEVIKRNMPQNKE